MPVSKKFTFFTQKKMPFGPFWDPPFFFRAEGLEFFFGHFLKICKRKNPKNIRPWPETPSDPPPPGESDWFFRPRLVFRPRSNILGFFSFTNFQKMAKKNIWAFGPEKMGVPKCPRKIFFRFKNVKILESVIQFFYSQFYFIPPIRPKIHFTLKSTFLKETVLQKR